MGGLGITPADFWAMTPVEFAALVAGRLERAGAGSSDRGPPITRAEVDDMIAEVGAIAPSIRAPAAVNPKLAAPRPTR